MPGHGLGIDTVARLIESQFPDWIGRAIVPVLPGGWDNRTFRLGDDLVVRLPSAERYVHQVAREQAGLRALAGAMPTATPEPVAIGQPGAGYPWHWSVLRWIPGVPAAAAEANSIAFATRLGAVLTALRRADATGGPKPGPENFHRGAALTHYDDQVRAALDRLDDPRPAAELWATALAAPWRSPPVWVHGDIAPGNVIVADGQLAGLIDWGLCAVGDPACDLAIGWTFLCGDARRPFRDIATPDAATWVRARGWALWKALILATGVVKGPAADIAAAPRVLRELLD